MSNEQLGNAVRMHVDINPSGVASYATLNCEQSSSFAFNTDTVATTSKCDDGDAAHKIVGTNYSSTFAGTASLSDPGIQQLITSQITKAFVKFEWKTESLNKYTGEGSIDITLDADTAGVVMFSGTLTVSGGLVQAVA